MSVGDQNYQTGMTMGRIEFSPRVGADPFELPPVKVFGYTVETFGQLARTLCTPNLCWLIEVSFGDEPRAPRYFTGECEAGWVGCTTIRADLAQKYSSKELAENDIAKLAPRLIGKWVAREHGFS